MDNTTTTTAGIGDAEHAHQDPLSYMIYHGVNPTADFTDYSPAQAMGLVKAAQGAVAQMHGHIGATRVSYSDPNRPKHLRTVTATLSNIPDRQRG
jgi:hypothetical protein